MLKLVNVYLLLKFSRHVHFPFAGRIVQSCFAHGRENHGSPIFQLPSDVCWILGTEKKKDDTQSKAEIFQIWRTNGMSLRLFVCPLSRLVCCNKQIESLHMIRSHDLTTVFSVMFWWGEQTFDLVWWIVLYKDFFLPAHLADYLLNLLIEAGFQWRMIRSRNHGVAPLQATRPVSQIAV